MHVYAGILYDLYMHAPDINKRIKTMIKKYPELSDECYERERNYLVIKKVEKEIDKLLSTPVKQPKKSFDLEKRYKNYEKKYKPKKQTKKQLQAHKRFVEEYDLKQLSPQIQHVELQEKVDEIKHLEAELPYVETKDEQEAIIGEIVDIAKELKQMKPKRTYKKKVKGQGIQHRRIRRY